MVLHKSGWVNMGSYSAVHTEYWYHTIVGKLFWEILRCVTLRSCSWTTFAVLWLVGIIHHRISVDFRYHNSAFRSWGESRTCVSFFLFILDLISNPTFWQPSLSFSLWLSRGYWVNVDEKWESLKLEVFLKLYTWVLLKGGKSLSNFPSTYVICSWVYNSRKVPGMSETLRE